MSDVTLFGFAPSTYVRTCRLALSEKGVDYDLVENMPNSPEQLAHHPFGKVPALQHGDLNLFEASAIASYVDEAFDGQALTPTGAAGRAQMNQWISAYNDYINPNMVRRVVVQRVVVPQMGGQTDEAVVAEAAKATDGHLQVLEKALAGGYLVGSELSLADLFLLPAVDYFSKMPEGEMLKKFENVGSWFGRMMARESAAAAGIAA